MNNLDLDDKNRQKSLRRMKVLASLMLVVAAVVFVVAYKMQEQSVVWGYVRATAEAAMVGALADWFAVTALFKHPLGLPIPHTAIVQKRKEQIGASLGGFVEHNFLTNEVIKGRLESSNLAASIGHWLSEDDNAQLIGKQVGASISGITEVLEDDTVQKSLEEVIYNKINSIEAGPVLSRGLLAVTQDGHHQILFNSVLNGFASYLEDNISLFRQKFNEESPWWVPAALDDKVFDKIYNSVHKFVDEILADPDHPLRLEFDRRIRLFATELETSPDMRLKAEGWKQQLLNHDEVRKWVGSIWQRSKNAILEASEDPNSSLRLELHSFLISTGLKLQEDKELQAKVNTWMINVAIYLAEEFRPEAARLISSTVNSWDSKETAERLELQVGRDLQFIRINGTIVGGLAGLLIYTISQVLL